MAHELRAVESRSSRSTEILTGISNTQTPPAPSSPVCALLSGHPPIIYYHNSRGTNKGKTECLQHTTANAPLRREDSNSPQRTATDREEDRMKSIGNRGNGI